MKISIDTSIFNKEPHFKIGIIHYTKITVASSPQMIKGRLQLYQESLFLEWQEKGLQGFEGIMEWRSLWKQLGADPNRYRHSAESLLRRISKQNYLQPTNSGVDLNNFFSLQYEIPVGLYNVANLNGDVTISLGTEHTGYEALNGRFTVLNHILHTADEEGPFGSPYVDSIRTAVTENTTDAIQIFYLRPSLTTEQAEQLLGAAGKMFTQVNGGDFESFVLSHLNVEQ